MTDSERGGPLTTADAQWPEEYRSDDEISLFDLWLVLIRRRWVVIAVGAVIFALAAAFAFMKEQTFEYSTAIEVGSFVRSGPNGSERVPIQPPKTVQQRLSAAFIPMARNEIDTPENRAPRVNLSFEDGSDVLVLRTEAPEAEQERVKQLHQHIVDLTVQAHDDIVRTERADRKRALDQREQQLEYVKNNIIEQSRIQPVKESVEEAKRRLESIRTNYQAQRVQLENQRENTKLNLADLEDQRDLLKAKVKRLEEERALIQQQLDKSQSVLQDLLSMRARATEEVSGSPQAMSLLMMSTQVEQARERVDNLETRLEIALPQRGDELQNQLDDNTRAQSRTRNELAALEKRLAKLENDFQSDLADQRAQVASATTNLEQEKLQYSKSVEDQQLSVRAAENNLEEIIPTRGVYVALKSLEPAGPGKAVILVLGLLLGGMLGIFAAFVVEFVSRANQHARRAQGVSQ